MLREFAGLLKRVSAVAGVASLVVFAGQANAVSYVGSWDPQLPSPFSAYRWEGTVQFDLPCLSPGNTFTGTTNSGNCSGLSLTSGTVEFFDTHGTATLADDTLVDTLNFLPVAASTLTKVVLSNGTPTGVWGDFNIYLQSSIYATGVNASNGTAALWELSFKGLPKLSWEYTKCQTGDDKCERDRFRQVSSYYQECETFTGQTRTTGSGAPEWISFYAVPEPGSLALMLPALGAFAFVRRRKDKAASATLA